MRLFVARPRQERPLGFAANAKRRNDLIDDLLHDRRRLASECLVPIDHSLTIDAIAREMTKRGAGKRAYVISQKYELDDREVPLAEALTAIVASSTDSLVFAIGSRVAYYENHESERFLLNRKK